MDTHNGLFLAGLCVISSRGIWKARMHSSNAHVYWTETCEYQRRGLHSSRFRHLMSYTLVYLVHEYPIIKSKYPIVLQKKTNTVSGRSLRPRPKRVIWRGNYPAGYGEERVYATLLHTPPTLYCGAVPYESNELAPSSLSKLPSQEAVDRSAEMW